MTKKEFLKIWNRMKVAKIEEMPKARFERLNKAIMGMKLAKIDVLTYNGRPEKVEYKTRELVARCPMTGLPDFYKLRITYIPKKRIPELKSFKNYLFEYFDLPITHEQLASKIYEDFTKTIKPKSCYLCLRAARRGGIDTRVEIGDTSLR